MDAFDVWFLDYKQPQPYGYHEKGKPFAVPSCLVCGRQFSERDAHGEPIYAAWEPLGRPGIGCLTDGVICKTYGNFGSRIFDSDGEVLIFTVCDRCLDERRSRVQCFSGGQRVPVALHLGRLR